MSVASGAESREGGADSASVLDSATIPDNFSADDPKYAFLNELLQQREQDLLAAADIGEMLLEKNRGLNQKIAELQARLDEQARCSRGSEGLTLSSEGDDDDSDDDESSGDERLNADGSVILTGRKGRVSLLHETQMTQRRTSFKGQALREAQERQQELERVTRETERADETIALLLADDLVLRTLLHWRKLTDVSRASRLQSQNAELQASVDSLQRQSDTAAAAAAEAEQRAEAAQGAATASAAAAEAAASASKETIATLQQDLERSQTTKMQQKEDFETQIAALNQSLEQGEQAQGKLVAEAASLQNELQASQALVANTQQALDASQQLLQHLQEDKETLQSQFDQACAEKKALEAAVEEGKTHMEKAHAREEAASAQLHADLARMQTEHEATLQELRSQNAMLNGMMEDAKVDSEAKVLQVASAKDKELSELRNKLQHTRDEQQQMKLATQEARQMLEQVEAEYQGRVKSLEEDNETLKQRCQQQIDALREAKQSQVHSLSEELSSLQAETERLIKDATDSKKAAQELVRNLEEKLRLADESNRNAVASSHDKERQVQHNVTQLAALQQELLSEQQVVHSLRQELEASGKQVRQLRDKVQQLDNDVEEAKTKKAHMKVLFNEKLRTLSQDVKRGLLVIHERSYRTETLAADIEVEVARYTTNMKNTHHLEMAALERQMVAVKSQAQLAEQKLSVEAMSREEDLKAQVQMLTSHMAQKEEILKSLRDDKSVTLAKSQQSLDLLQIEVDDKTAAVKSLEDELKRQEANGREIQNRLNATEARHNETLMELESAKRTLTDRAEQESRMKEGIESLGNQLAKSNQELAMVENEFAAAKREHAATLQQYLDEKDAVAQEAVENMMTLEAEIKSLKSEVRDLTAKLQYAEDGLVELKQAKQMALSQLVARCDTLERGIDVANSETGTANQELSLLRKKMQESYVQAQREKNELNDQMKLMEDRLKRLRLEAEDCEKNLKAEVREREAENKLLNESLHEQKSVNKTLDESNRRLQGSLRFQLTGLRSDLDSSKLLDSSLMDEAEKPGSPDKSTHWLQEKSILSKSLREDKEEDEDLLEDFASQIERIKLAMHNAEKLNAQLIAKASSLDGTVQEQISLNQTLQQEVARANEKTAQMSESEGKAQRLAEENTKQQEKIKKLQQSLEKLKKTAHDQLEIERSQREKELAQLEQEVSRLIALEQEREADLIRTREELAAANRETKKAEDAAKEKVATADAAREAMQQQLESLTKERDQSNAKVESADAAREAMQQQLESLTKERDQSNAKVESAGAAREVMQQQLESLTKERDQNNATGEELSRLKGHCATVEGHLKVEKDLVAELKIHVQEKTQEVDLKGSQLKDKDLELETKLAEISRLKAQIQTHESEKTTQAANLALTHSRHVEQLEDKTKKLQEQLEEANKDLVTADTAAQQLEVKLTRSEQDKNLLQQQLDRMSTSKVQDRGALDLPQVQEVQERFDKYRELAAAQLEEAKGKISRLEHQLDDRIIEADMAQNKAKEEMREREKERLEAVRRESDAVQAAADTQHRRLREMSTATALKKLSDLHKMETDELYCQMIVLRNNQSQLLDDLVALHMQKSAEAGNQESGEASTGKREENSSPPNPKTLKRQLQDKLGRARAEEEKAIREELQRLTNDASAKRLQLMAKESLSVAAA